MCLPQGWQKVLRTNSGYSLPRGEGCTAQNRYRVGEFGFPRPGSPEVRDTEDEEKLFPTSQDPKISSSKKHNTWCYRAHG